MIDPGREDQGRDRFVGGSEALLCKGAVRNGEESRRNGYDRNPPQRRKGAGGKLDHDILF
jgi:hypothetical protein